MATDGVYVEPGMVRFGRHIWQLRRARGYTQEVLAERSDLSADTIRRLERGGAGSPTLDTLIKLCHGLDLLLSTFFSAFELCENDASREVIDLLGDRSPREQAHILRVLRVMLAGMDALHDTHDAHDTHEGLDLDDDADPEPID